VALVHQTRGDPVTVAAIGIHQVNNYNVYTWRRIVEVERVLLKQPNYLDWEEYIRDELLARGLWAIVEGTTERPRNPTVAAVAGGVKGRKQDAAQASESASAAGTAQMVSETTPESIESV
jgi:hypothetical protein